MTLNGEPPKSHLEDVLTDQAWELTKQIPTLDNAAHLATSGPAPAPAPARLGPTQPAPARGG